MKPVVFTKDSLRRLLLGSAAVAMSTLTSTAQAQTCRPDHNDYEGDCRHYNAQTTINTGGSPPNVADLAAAPLGEMGFSISIDDVAAGPDQLPLAIAGAPPRAQKLREIDRLLDIAGVDLTYDGLGGRPRLAISTDSMRESYASGESVTFRASSNYPAWINAAEVVITDKHGRNIARLPIRPNGTAAWIMPAEGADEYLYFLRVSDAKGRKDETRRLPLKQAATPWAQSLNGPVIAAAEGDDMTLTRGIPLQGGAVTVSGQSVTGQSVNILGEDLPVDASGRFVVQRILPPGTHSVAIMVDGRRLDRSVTIAQSEWFKTGILDLTVGKDEDGTWKMGRVAGFAQGTLADGTRITGSVDTEEDELRDLFRDFGRKNPDQTLREMRSDDIFNTFGDDSEISDLAPSSGKLFLRAERDGSHIQWGDFKPLETTGLSVRSDRALYGISGEYRAPNVTQSGDPKLRITGFAANADSLMQRDILRATGGSAYFLSRQDLLLDSETVMVQVVSRTTGLVTETRHLREGSDYRINNIQGLVMLHAPLSAHISGAGLISDNPLGDYDINLVVQYEYVPTTSDVEGYTGGARSEAWVNDQIRMGASAIRETTGMADNDLIGADILWRGSETREVLLEYAVSEGPGFGASFSLNGGMDLEPGTPSYGLPGLRANSWRIGGKTDLNFAGQTGEITGFFDQKDAGFSSPDQNFEYDQNAWVLSGHMPISARSALTFGTEGLKRDDGKREETARLGLKHELDDTWHLEGEIAHDHRDLSTTRGDDFGTRQDLAMRLTWARDQDLSAWVTGQATLAHDSTRHKNDRIGIGAQMRLSDRTDLSGEVSEGSMGTAAALELGYRANGDSNTRIGYALDPQRRYDSTDFSGRDKGSLIFSQTSKLDENWSFTTENSYSAFGTRPALTSGYGVTYTPSQLWQYDAMLQYGENREDDGTALERRGLSLGVRHNPSDQLSWGLRGEWREEVSDRADNALDRKTWLSSGFYEDQISDDWRFISSLDAVISDSDQSSFRDGRYIEARLGYAWRPIDNDRVNALASYTYLYDLPGADQVNIDGNTEGDRQKSHIINTAINWQANPVWTLGAKYGYRFRESSAREATDFTTSEAHLAVLRADYHIVHNWDVMGEVRSLYHTRINSTENAALLGVYRHVGENFRLGGGYLWGEVDDDLRKTEPPRTGFFVNMTGQF